MCTNASLLSSMYADEHTSLHFKHHYPLGIGVEGSTSWKWYGGGNGENSSGKVMNPGKHLFLNLAAAAVADVNRQLDAEGVSYARKEMIITGIAPKINSL